MDADDSNLQRLTIIAGGDILAAWSPGEKRIAFTLVDNWDNTHIYTINIDGSNFFTTNRSCGNKLPAVLVTISWE